MSYSRVCQIEKQTDLAPNMRRVLVDKGLSRITKEQLRDNEESDILLAIKSFLQHMATIAVGREINDATSDQN